MLILNPGRGSWSETGCLLREGAEGSCLWELGVVCLEDGCVGKGREIKGRVSHRGPPVKPGQAEE